MKIFLILAFLLYNIGVYGIAKQMSRIGTWKWIGIFSLFFIVDIGFFIYILGELT